MSENSTETSALNQPIPIDNIIDVFYGILISPIKTFDALISTHSAGISSLLGPVMIVFLAALAESTTGINSSTIIASAIALNIFCSVIGKLFFWSVLIFFLFLLAAFLKQQASLRSHYLVTGWAFVPLVFKGVATCLSNATELGDTLSWCLSIWFLLLQLFAFDSVLKLGRFKTLGIILILPPCLFFAYFFSMLFAGLMISDAFF